MIRIVLCVSFEYRSCGTECVRNIPKPLPVSKFFAYRFWVAGRKEQVYCFSREGATYLEVLDHEFDICACMRTLAYELLLYFISATVMCFRNVKQTRNT